MREPYASSPSVVVGVDGSRAAMQAALWGLDEAVARDVPLWLLHAIDDTATDPDDAAAEVAAAQNTVRSAITAIESLGESVKLEAEIVHRHPVAALLDASRSAAMVCVGSIGYKHATCGRIGSTAAAVAASAHCPVTIVPRSAHPGTGGAGLVLAVVDGSPASDTVLERSTAEARLRGAPLRIFVRPPARPKRAGNDPSSPSEQRIIADLEPRLDHWRQSGPPLDTEWVRDHTGLLNYLEHLQRNATPIQLIVVGPQHPGPADVLMAPAGRAAMEAAGCALLVCDRTWWL